MSYQPQVRSAIWTTLVLLVGVAATNTLAAPKYSAVARTDQQQTAARPRRPHLRVSHEAWTTNRWTRVDSTDNRDLSASRST